MASTESNSPSAPGEKQSVSPSQHTDLTESTSSENFQADALRKFSYSELLEATFGLSNSVYLGGGAFGGVYKGCLPIGKFIAVKKLYYMRDGQHKEEFENRINVIGMARHRHLVSLIGYCCEEYDRLLVLEFVPNRSLRFHLSDAKRRSILKWSKRMKIAIGSAKGLEYLHEYCEPKIIHGGIKPENILLDHNFEPKVADFGLAILSETDKAASIYVDSNISNSQKISEKSDIYSFGITLLELITGRRIHEDGTDIVNWARPLIVKEGSINVDYNRLVDSTLKGDYDRSEMERIIYCVAASVYSPSLKLRPRMRDILEALEGVVSHKELWIEDVFIEKQPVSPPQHANLNKSRSSEDFEAHGPRKFTFEELAIATSHFSNTNVLGIDDFGDFGDFGDVYKGILPNGEIIAIRKLTYVDEQLEEEFENQIMAVGKVRHRNLVRLIGYCCEEYDKLLVLEFIPNKSLRFHLSDTKQRSNLKWSKRMKIAIDSAKGLGYLHEHHHHSKIIHKDIKADNVLLDENFTPKIADFGLAEFFPKTDTRRISTDRKEASIYTDPKISDSQSIFDGSDIYSFGIVLLELITGRRNKDIVNWARPLMIKGDSINVDYDRLVDSTLEGQYDQSELERIIYCIAASIYTPSSKLGPKMGQILEALEGLIPHQQLWAVEEKLNNAVSTGTTTESKTILEEGGPSETITSVQSKEHKEITEVSNQLWSKATSSQGTEPKIMQIQEMPAESNYSTEHKDITEVSNQLWSKATSSQGTEPKIMQIQEMPAESNYSALEPAAMLSETSLEATPQSAIPPSRLMKIYHILNKIVTRIENSNVSTIGVYGGEGIGKTTLLEALKIQPAIRDMFHFVIWVSVPKVWNLREVQLQIGRQLPLPDKKIINAWTLLSFLESVKFILILDGVHGFISLNIVGIPEPTPENGSKIVLTTRSAEVCDRMSADLKINLEYLFWELFCENVGEIVHSFKLQPLAPKVVDLCCNHSHAIFLMSKALKDESDVRVWNNAVEMLSRQPASPEQEIEKVMVNILKFSYDRLPDDTTRRCLKNCALFFEKQEIARESLIDNWISDDLMDMYQKGQKVIETLVTAGLLESSEDGQVFKLHEIDRYLLLEHVFPSRLFLRRKDSRLTGLLMDENWENSDEIYLMDNELTELSEKLSSQAQAFFLQRNLKLRKISDTFFQDMLALQILNLSVTSIKSLPDSLFGLVNLKRLSLNRCVLLKLLPSSVGDLSCLEVLHLEGTAIVALPREVEHLKNLTSLKVSFREPVSFDHPRKMISDGVIKKLSKLKNLCIDVSPEDGRWKASVISIVLEVCSLTTLDTLQFYFPNVELLSQINWDTTPPSPPLSHFKFIVGDHTNRIICRLPHDVDVELGRYDKCLKYVNGEGAPEEIKKVLRHTSAFFLDRNMTIEKLSEFEISNMMQLKCCVAGECDKLQTIIEGDQMVTSASGEVELGLESLEYLYIYYAKSLRSICEGRLDNSSFKKLKYLTLHMCPELTIIFTPELLVNLSSLEELTVDDCSEVKSLVHCKDNEHEIKHILPALKKISFHFLPELDSISDVVSMAPRIEWMGFYYCPNLKSLPISKAFHTKLRQIKGEESWWQSLEWQNNEQDSNWEDIFTPVDEWD